jgi:hypothetical protein
MIRSKNQYYQHHNADIAGKIKLTHHPSRPSAL